MKASFMSGEPSARKRFLGHANIQETVNTYTHILPDTGRSQMELLADVVNY